MNPISDQQMLRKAAVGCDHLADYLEKRMAIKNYPDMPWVAYPSLGELHPAPHHERRGSNSSAMPAKVPNLQRSQDLQRSQERPINPAPTNSPGPAADDPKVVALKQWTLNTAGEIRTTLGLLKSNVTSASDDAALMPFARAVSAAKKELDNFLPVLAHGIPSPPGPTRPLTSRCARPWSGFCNLVYPADHRDDLARSMPYL